MNISYSCIALGDNFQRLVGPYTNFSKLHLIVVLAFQRIIYTIYTCRHTVKTNCSIRAVAHTVAFAYWILPASETVDEQISRKIERSNNGRCPPKNFRVFSIIEEHKLWYNAKYCIIISKMKPPAGHRSLIFEPEITHWVDFKLDSTQLESWTVS